MPITRQMILLIGLLGLASGICADPAPPGRFTVGRYLDLQSAGSPQISPDGALIVYTRSVVDKQQDQPQSALWIINSDGSHHRFLAKGNGAVWSPDGKSIAFLAEGEPKGLQIFVLDPGVAGTPSQITRVFEEVANLRWSPDGKSIGFTMTVPNAEKWSVDLPPAPEGAKWASTPRYTERLHYRRDHAGFTERGWRQLFLVARDGGTPLQVTRGDWSIGQNSFEIPTSVGWDFTPDGRSAIVEGYKEGDPDRNDRESTSTQWIWRAGTPIGSRKRRVLGSGLRSPRTAGPSRMWDSPKPIRIRSWTCGPCRLTAVIQRCSQPASIGNLKTLNGRRTAARFISRLRIAAACTCSLGLRVNRSVN